MESGAKGCEVVVSGKLRGQRAKSMKFVDGLMIHSGDPINDYVDTAVRHVLLRQGNCNQYFNPIGSRRIKRLVKVFRIVPEFRILRLTFQRKSASKC